MMQLFGAMKTRMCSRSPTISTSTLQMWQLCRCLCTTWQPTRPSRCSTRISRSTWRIARWGTFSSSARRRGPRSASSRAWKEGPPVPRSNVRVSTWKTRVTRMYLPPSSEFRTLRISRRVKWEWPWLTARSMFPSAERTAKREGEKIQSTTTSLKELNSHEQQIIRGDNTFLLEGLLGGSEPKIFGIKSWLNTKRKLIRLNWSCLRVLKRPFIKNYSNQISALSFDFLIQII